MAEAGGYGTVTATNKKKRSGSNWLIATLSVILVVALMITGFWKPGFFIKGRSEGYAYNGPSYAGDSEAFAIEPFPGFAVEAQENALDRDRSFDVEKASDEAFTEISRAMEERGLLLMEMYELDAGLDESKRFPGTFTMTFDLAELGIPEALHDYATVYRISDNGAATELTGSLEDGSLVCRSDKNCGIALTIVYGAVTFGASFLGASAVRDQGEKWEGLSDKDLIQLDTGNGQYRVSWAVNDSSEWKGKKDKLDDLYQQIKQGLIDEMTSAGSSSGYAMAQGFNQLLAEKLAKSENYQRLLRELNNTEWIIKNNSTVQAMQVIDGLDKIHAYMTGKLGLTPPPGKTDILLIYDWTPGDTAVGYAVNPISAAPYVRINMSLLPQDGSKAPASIIDDVYLTLTHELCHVFQTSYTTVDWDSNVLFWEATAVMVETQARKDYLGNKNRKYPTISTQPALTDSDWFESLSVTLGEMPAGGEEQDCQRNGYTLSRFLTFLQENGYSFDVRKLLETYKITNDFRATVQSVTGIRDTTLGDLYLRFCKENTQRFYQRYNDALKTRGVKSTLIPPVSLSAINNKVEVTVADTPLSAYIREFRVDTATVGPYALFLVSDDSLKGKQNYSLINVTAGVTKAAKGLFYPVRTEASAYLFEIHSYTQKDDRDAFYSAYLLTPPRAPALSVDKTIMTIEMPPDSPAAQDGLIDGYRITITASDGVKQVSTEKFVPYKKWDVPLKLELGKLSNLTGDITYSVTAQEYIKDSSGRNNLYGPASLEISHEGQAAQNDGCYTGTIPFSFYDSEGKSGSNHAPDQIVTIEEYADGTCTITFDYYGVSTEKWAPATDTTTVSSATVNVGLSGIGSYTGEVDASVAKSGTYQGKDVSGSKSVQWSLKINWNRTSHTLDLELGGQVYSDIPMTKSGS